MVDMVVGNLEVKVWRDKAGLELTSDLMIDEGRSAMDSYRISLVH
jgi:hypothetical protein